jgi:hypothetical protein
VVAFHKSLDAEIKVRDNHHLPLLFASMLEHRAEKNTSFTIPKKEKWEDIRHRLGKGVKRDLLLALPGGLLEPVPLQPGGYWVTADDGSRYQVIERSCAALPFGYTNSPFLVLLDSRGRRYVHQGEVFGLLMAALLEAYTMKGLKEKVEKDYCNITTVVVDDFLRALNVCYYLAGVSAPAGSMRFESVRPPLDHKAYMQSDYLQKVLPKVARSLSDAGVNETTAERLKEFLARNTMAATANTGGIGKKRGREGAAGKGAAGEGAAGEGAAGEGAADELKVRRLMVELGMSKVLALLLGATACTTVVIVGTMDEGQLQDQPFQRRLLGISVAGQYLELGGSENQKHLAFVGLLMCLVAAMVIFLKLRRRWQLSCKDPWKNLATGRNCKDLEAALQTLAEEDLKVLVEGIQFHLERPEVVAGALTAVLKIMAGPHAAKVFQVPAVADEKADENARKAFRVGVLEVTLASMERHMRERDVLAPACGVLWAINASPKAVDIRVDTADRGGIPLLFGALVSFVTDPVIVEAVLSAMGNLMYKNDDNKGAMMAARARLNNGKEASVVELAIELLNADSLLWYESSSYGTYLPHAGVKESVINVLRKLANTPPLFTPSSPSRPKSTAKELLKKLGVEAHVQAAMNRPHATDKLKKDGQKLLDRLRRRKNVPEADAKETAHD